MLYVLAMQRDYDVFRNPSNEDRRPGWYGPFYDWEAVRVFVRRSECSVFVTRYISPNVYEHDKQDTEAIENAKKPTLQRTEIA